MDTKYSFLKGLLYIIFILIQSLINTIHFKRTNACLFLLHVFVCLFFISFSSVMSCMSHNAGIVSQTV